MSSATQGTKSPTNPVLVKAREEIEEGAHNGTLSEEQRADLIEWYERVDEAQKYLIRLCVEMENENVGHMLSVAVVLSKILLDWLKFEGAHIVSGYMTLNVRAKDAERASDEFDKVCAPHLWVNVPTPPRVRDAARALWGEADVRADESTIVDMTGGIGFLRAATAFGQRLMPTSEKDEADPTTPPVGKLNYHTTQPLPFPESTKPRCEAGVRNHDFLAKEWKRWLRTLDPKLLEKIKSIFRTVQFENPERLMYVR